MLFELSIFEVDCLINRFEFEWLINLFHGSFVVLSLLAWLACVELINRS
jgi:hypothetical protein